MPLSPAELAALHDIERRLVDAPVRPGGSSTHRVLQQVVLACAAILLAFGVGFGNVAGIILGVVWGVVVLVARWASKHLVIVAGPVD